MKAPVRVGMVGTSWMAENAHLASLKSHPGAKVVAVCGRNQARVEELAAKYAIPLCYCDYRQMIASGELQALVAVVPDDPHHPVVMEALDAGLHVLCEKPLASNRSQAKEMLDKATLNRLVHMTFFTYRWLPVYRYALRLIQEGYLGRCFSVEARYLAGYGLTSDYQWRFDPGRSAGVLGDLGSHMIDLVRLCAGEISRVFGQLATFLPKRGPQGEQMVAANDHATLALEFSGGAHGVVQLSSVAHRPDQEQHLVLSGDEGMLEVDVVFARGSRICGARKGDTEVKELPIPAELLGPTGKAGSLFETLAPIFQSESVGDRHFIDAILGGTAATPSFGDGYHAQAVIDAAIESHATGRWVPLAPRS